MKHPYYEIHATYLEALPTKGLPSHWKTSKIDGDPDFGDGVRYYVTVHTPSLALALQTVEQLQRAEEGLLPPAMRWKIELILLDERRDES